MNDDVLALLLNIKQNLASDTFEKTEREVHLSNLADIYCKLDDAIDLLIHDGSHFTEGATFLH